MIFMPIYWIDNDRYVLPHDGDMKKWYRLSWKLVGLRKMLFLCFKVDTAKACRNVSFRVPARLMWGWWEILWRLAHDVWQAHVSSLPCAMVKHGETDRTWSQTGSSAKDDVFFDQASLSKSMKRLQSSKAKLFFEHQELGSIDDKHIKKS
jgi:hypothetical protein